MRGDSDGLYSSYDLVASYIRIYGRLIAENFQSGEEEGKKETRTRKEPIYGESRVTLVPCPTGPYRESGNSWQRAGQRQCTYSVLGAFTVSFEPVFNIATSADMPLRI